MRINTLEHPIRFMKGEDVLGNLSSPCREGKILVEDGEMKGKPGEGKFLADEDQKVKL